MDHFADERDERVLERDKYTFFILSRIIREECGLLLSDHERLILCLSALPHPVWIWTAEDATEAEKERAYDLIREHGLLSPEYTFNVKYDMAEYLIHRASEDGRALSVKLNLYAYDCPNPMEPHVRADGGIHPCTGSDTDELTELIALFHRETGVDQDTPEAYRRKAEEGIRSGSHFFWQNAEGHHVAVCSCRPNGDMAGIGSVYTRETDRRKHYAENLVYQVTKNARDAGYMPILYTDADYAASNACYEKIGYVLQGSLCTVG